MNFWTGFWVAKALESKPQENGGCLVPLEIIAISLAAGHFCNSWWAFGGALLGLFFILANSRLSTLFSITMSLGWGCVGFLIGSQLIHDIGAAVVLAIIFALIAFGSHVSFLEDLTR